MKNILFVCTGNTCRSPMAEIILKSKLKLAGENTVRVSSAGLCAEDGAKINPKSFEALKLLGYKPYGFKAKNITDGRIKRADVIICMTASQKAALGGIKGVYSMGEMTGKGDIKDPYGGSLSVYIETSHEIEDACNIILEKILEK